MIKQAQQERDEAQAWLRERLKPGDIVYTQVLHVSRSGMSRVIAPYLIRDSEVTNLVPWVGKACGLALDRDRGGVKLGGCGMDMGFALVYELSHALYPAGFGCIGEHCPSNDHLNGDRNYAPHVEGHNRHWHNSGGYALVRRWLA